MSDLKQPSNGSKPGSRPMVLGGMAAPQGAKPAWTADQLRAALRAYDRTPFLDVLADWIECAPSIDAIVRLAEKSPDKFIVAMTSLSKVAGFSERREVVSLNINVKSMSDSQIEDRLEQLSSKLGVDFKTLLLSRDEYVEDSPSAAGAPQATEGSSST